MYTVWIKVDKTLPWTELKKTYTYEGARKAAEGFLYNMQVKIATSREAKQVELHTRRRKGVKTRKSMC